MCSQSEDKQADCLSKNASYNILHKHFCEFRLARAELPSSCKRSCCFQALHGIFSLQIKHLQISCNARKLSAECIIEMCGQSEDKQADCLNKNATCHIFSKAFLRVLACPNWTAQLLQTKRLFPRIHTISLSYGSSVSRYRAMRRNFQRNAA